jgi:hypothetical protein
MSSDASTQQQSGFCDSKNTDCLTTASAAAMAETAPGGGGGSGGGGGGNGSEDFNVTSFIVYSLGPQRLDLGRKFTFLKAQCTTS